MEFLLDPNIAYLVLVSGIFLTITAVFSPGTGLLELGAVFALVIAGWEVYNIPVNYWAFAPLAVGFILFVLALRKHGNKLYLGISILFLVTGSAFLFRAQQGWQPAVNPFLAIIASLLSAGYYWIAVRKTLEAASRHPTHDLHRLVGAAGEAKTEIFQEGSVQIFGELWSARSPAPIPAGAWVKVTARDGFTLVVEPVVQTIRENK
jgi:membrane-bound serine protease (ClpP class)